MSVKVTAAFKTAASWRSLTVPVNDEFCANAAAAKHSVPAKAINRMSILPPEKAANTDKGFCSVRRAGPDRLAHREETAARPQRCEQCTTSLLPVAKSPNQSQTPGSTERSEVPTTLRF